MSARAEEVQYVAQSAIGENIQNAKAAIEQWPDKLGGGFNTKKFKKEIRRSLNKIKGKVFEGELDEAYDIIDLVRDKVVTWVPEGSSKERFLRSLNNIEKAIDTGIWRSPSCCCCSNTQSKTTKSSKEKKKKEQRKR